MSSRQDTRRPNRELITGLVCAVAYFVAPLFVLTVMTLGVFFWTLGGYIGCIALVTGIIVAVPCWLLARALVGPHCRPAIGIPVFLLAGGAAAYLAFGVLALLVDRQFDPLDLAGSASGGGILLLIGYAALCSGLGWLTAHSQSKNVVYDDALDGLDFAELVELARRAQK